MHAILFVNNKIIVLIYFIFIILFKKDGGEPYTNPSNKSPIHHQIHSVGFRDISDYSMQGKYKK